MADRERRMAESNPLLVERIFIFVPFKQLARAATTARTLATSAAALILFPVKMNKATRQGSECNRR